MKTWSRKAMSSDVNFPGLLIRCVLRAAPEIAGFKTSDFDSENSSMIDVRDACVCWPMSTNSDLGTR